MTKLQNTNYKPEHRAHKALCARCSAEPINMGSGPKQSTKHKTQNKARIKRKMQNQNLDTIFNNTFKYAKKLAKEFYFTNWAKNPSKCPAFKGEIIHISRIGWEHIIHDEAKTRMDILGKIFILERAKKLLETATQFQDYEKRNGNEYWVFNAVVQDIKIRVIIKAIEGKEKHFLSVIRKGSVQKEIDNDNDVIIQ